MASGSNSLDQLTNVYKNVVDDVVREMREEFLNEAVDLEVLEDLKQIWLNKLSQSGAVNRPTQPQLDPGPKPVSSDHKPSKQQAQSSGSSGHKQPPTNPILPPPLVPVAQSGPPSFPQLTSSQDSTHNERDSLTVIQHAPPRSQTTPSAITAVHSSTSSQPPLMIHPSVMAAISSEAPPNSQAPQMLSAFQQGMVPIQTPQGTVLVPLSHLMALNAKVPMATQGSKSSQDKDVHQIDGYPPSPEPSTHHQQLSFDASLSQRAPCPSASSLTNDDVSILSLEPASRRVQQSCSKRNEWQKYSPSLDTNTKSVSRRSARKRRSCPQPGDTVEFVGVSSHMIKSGEGRVIVQLDGAQGDSSSEGDSDLEDSSEDELGGTDEGTLDEEPLNSDDDVGDEQEDKGFDTNDTIVCLWEKVYRVRTKWKFLLRMESCIWVVLTVFQKSLRRS